MSDQLSFDRSAASAAGDEGMSQALRAERVQLWKVEVEEWFKSVESGAWITADQLTAACGLPDEGVARNNVVGAWFSAKAKAGTIRFTGRFEKSSRVIGHGNLLRVWEKV